MNQQENPDEAIEKFIKERGLPAWIEFLGTGKIPNESATKPEKQNPKEWMENLLKEK